MRYVFVFGDSKSEDFSEERDLADFQQARDEAVRELSFLMSSRLPDGEQRLFTVSILDERRAKLYAASLSFEGRPTDAGRRAGVEHPEPQTQHS